MDQRFKYSDEQLRLLGNAIVWTTVLAAVHNDGVIMPEEKAAAVKQAHFRTFTSDAHLQPIYKRLDSHFEADFDNYSSMLPEGDDAKEEFVKEKLQQSLKGLEGLDKFHGRTFIEELRDLFDRVFKADSSIFQLFAFPIVSAHLDQFGLDIKSNK